ncbi:MAG: ABC transporter ATP-binding protein [Proteobacteria bacterium]|nr:ABC transporter ATP-binding protein [Pseudomonadota bacterium]MDA0862974.1 ABC transporter ATP-binding protein [Pseudomonadota bacterium]MDA1031198.1 ABC transporter ATP-binding protein [Pseudomonadota bacterium]
MAIDLKDVQYSYPSNPGKMVLNIPSWSVPEGDKTFLYGPSGGGKSTLLNALSGLIKTTGNVTIFGQQLNGLSAKQRDRFRAKNIGFVFQQFNLISYLDALDNIKLASAFGSGRRGKILEEEIKNLLSELNISADEWHEPARNLSIGQQQRIAIARSLINKPQLLIADEPTSSLDHANRDIFMSLLLNIVEEHNITLLLVSHDMSLSTHFSSTVSLNEINRIEEGG